MGLWSILAFSAFRISLIVLSFIFLIFGVGLVYTTAAGQTSYLVSTPTNVCQINYNSVLTPSQILSQNCTVASNDWVQLHLKSQFNMTLTIWLNSTSTHGLQLLYNTSDSRKISADFPIYYAGSLQANVDNYGTEPNAVSGNLSVLTMTQVSTPAVTTTHPFRNYGLGILLLSLLALFLLIWNPGRILTRRSDLKSTSDRLAIRRRVEEEPLADSR